MNVDGQEQPLPMDTGATHSGDADVGRPTHASLAGDGGEDAAETPPGLDLEIPDLLDFNKGGDDAAGTAVTSGGGRPEWRGWRGVRRFAEPPGWTSQFR